jgi:N-glycosylase/DNA lyase
LTESPTVTQNSTETPIEIPTEEPTETPTEMMSVEESHERRQRFWSYIPRGTDVPYLDHNTITQPEVLMSN